MELALAIACSLAFALTNGFHDAANAIATLVATRGASPGHAIVLSAVFNMLGAIIAGTAVADTIGGIVVVPQDLAVAVIGSGVLGATVWNVITWRRGLPSSSGHALVGGLVGAALATSGIDGVLWGGIDGWRPVGVFGVVIALAVSPVIGLVFGTAIARLTRWATRRATRRVHAPIRFGEWAMSAALSFSHGSNDGQKGMGLIMLILIGTVPTAYALNRAMPASQMEEFQMTSAAAAAVVQPAPASPRQSARAAAAATATRVSAPSGIRNGRARGANAA